MYIPTCIVLQYILVYIGCKRVFLSLQEDLAVTNQPHLASLTAQPLFASQEYEDIPFSDVPGSLGTYEAFSFHQKSVQIDPSYPESDRFEETASDLSLVDRIPLGRRKDCIVCSNRSVAGGWRRAYYQCVHCNRGLHHRCIPRHKCRKLFTIGLGI